MRLLLVLVVVMEVVTLARKLPHFDDPLLGRLVVSKKKFPFLTPSHSKDQAHVFPTDVQLTAIKAAVGGSKQFAIRAKRAAEEEENGDDDDFSGDTNTTNKAMEKYNNTAKFLGNFLKAEFTYEIETSIVDTGSLPFDKINSDAVFRAMILKKDMLKPYLENEFTPRMRNIASTEKPWLPAEKLIQELKECLYFEYGTASDEDFKFDKNTGGTMVYYKVTCMRVGNSFFIGLSTYDNKFTLHDLEHVDKIKKGWSFGASIMGWGINIGKQKEEIHRWFEKRYITLNDLKLLLDFIMRDFATRIRMEYKQYLETVNIKI